MQSVTLFHNSKIRLVGLGLAAALLIAAAGNSVATFQATTPGSDLRPVGGAEAVIDLIQGNKTILWSSLTGNVTNIRTVGWTIDDGTHQLGGALTLVRPTDGEVGIVNFGEKPMSMTFNIDD